MTVDLRTRYLGLELRSPIVASAAPHNGEPAMAAAPRGRGRRGDRPAVAVRGGDPGRGTRTQPARSNRGPSTSPRRSTTSRRSTRSSAPPTDTSPASSGSRPASGVPVIASLNASTAGGWVRHARRIEDAGADALELNLYHVAADPGRNGGRAWRPPTWTLIAAVRASITIPLAVKLSPYYSAFATSLPRRRRAGADGLVLFNRFYQPDLDLDSLEVVPRIELSQPWELRLPVRWIAILRPQLGPAVSLAATSGVHSGTDVVKGLMVGADVVMMTSALLRHGPEHVADRRDRAADVDDGRGSTSRSTSSGGARARRRPTIRPRSSEPTTWRRYDPGWRPRS